MPSPSEFELPDNDASLGYALADADIIDAYGLRMMKCDKDPLEESDNDNVSTHGGNLKNVVS